MEINYKDVAIEQFVSENLPIATRIVKDVEKEGGDQNRKRDRARELFRNELNRKHQVAWEVAKENSKKETDPGPDPGPRPRVITPEAYIGHIIERAVIAMKFETPAVRK